MKYDFDSVIIGSGIAGMSAALYLKRAGANILLLDNDAPGGLLNKITVVENYPGVKNITGPDLAYSFYEQLQDLQITPTYGKVSKISDSVVYTDNGNYTAKTIIIATGRRPKKLGLEANFKNISYCALCDGNLYKNKVVAVIGAGNSAIEEAIYLSNLCSKVIILCRSDVIRADQLLIDEAKTKSNIEILTSASAQAFRGENDIVQKIELENSTLSVDGIFIYIGYEPVTEFVSDIELDNGYIVVNKNMQTNIANIFAAGDIIKKDIYQLITAASEGAIAAINAKKQI